MHACALHPRPTRSLAAMAPNAAGSVAAASTTRYGILHDVAVPHLTPNISLYQTRPASMRRSGGRRCRHRERQPRSTSQHPRAPLQRSDYTAVALRTSVMLASGGARHSSIRAEGCCCAIRQQSGATGPPRACSLQMKVVIYEFRRDSTNVVRVWWPSRCMEVGVQPWYGAWSAGAV
jgi:hypothetical protein